MHPVGPAETYTHNHPPVRDVAVAFEASLSPGQRIADRLASLVGSWPFILIQSVILFAWVVANIYFMTHPGVLKAWDPYPFILLNLVLSFQAAYTGPIVMMSQNRQAQKDRIEARSDYECNQKAEEEIRIMMEHLVHQDRMMRAILDRLDHQNERRQ